MLLSYSNRSVYWSDELMSESPETLIESLWILEKESGICIFEEYYVDFTREGIETDLIASFLSALLSFADEAFEDAIEHIKFSNRKIVFEFSECVLFVVSVNDDAPATDYQIKKAIEQIAKKFNEKYCNVLEHGKWGGNVELFSNFSQDLKVIVMKEPLSIKLLQLLDFKEHFKKVESFVNKHKEIAMKRKERIEKFFVEKKKKLDSDRRKTKVLEDQKALEHKDQK